MINDDIFGKSHMVITWSNGREQGVALEAMIDVMDNADERIRDMAYEVCK